MSSHAATEHVHGHPALQHHFENMEQQREAGTLGMWIFLVTEIMFFGGMFLAYALYRNVLSRRRSHQAATIWTFGSAPSIRPC